MVDGKKIKTLRVPIQSVVTTVEGRRVCFKMNKKNQPVPVPVETGYYDQTHIQITTGLALGDTILKAPLLHAKELNVGGGLFGYRQINADDFFKDLPETVEPAKPTPSSTSGEPQPSTAQKAPPTKGGQGKGRPGGGSGRSSEPPAELSLTVEQKTKWAAASKTMSAKRATAMAGQDWAAMRTLRDEFTADLEKFLTKEQLAKYAALRTSASGSGGSGNRPGGGGGGGRAGSLMDLDTDSDGKVSEEEYAKTPERMRQFVGEFSALDTDGDGGINKEEADAARQRMMQRFQGGGGAGGSGGN
jgi:hypothetical protein